MQTEQKIVHVYPPAGGEDATALLQHAMEEAGPDGKVYLHPGTYSMTSPLSRLAKRITGFFRRASRNTRGGSMKTIILPDEQYELLVQTLAGVQDDGPEGEGWKSPELKALIEHIEQSASNTRPAP